MKKYSIGVDIGGTNVKLGLVTPSGKVLLRRHFLTKEPRDKTAFLDALARHIHELVAEGEKRKIVVTGVGIGAPGPIDVKKGFVYFFPNIPGWKNTPLKDILEKKLRLPVRVDNDANVMALAEFLFGAGKGAADLIALTLGTGIGGGLVIGGKLFHGPAYSAAEIGHLIINEKGPLCACGDRGCVEAYVGNGYFTREVKKRLNGGAKSVLMKWIRAGSELTPLLVAQAAKRGDRFSKEVWNETGEHLGTALAGLVNILNPQKIILGGGIAQNGNVLFRPVIRTIRKKAFPIAARSVKVIPAKLGVDAGLVGAAALMFMNQNPE